MWRCWYKLCAFEFQTALVHPRHIREWLPGWLLCGALCPAASLWLLTSARRFLSFVFSCSQWCHLQTKVIFFLPNLIGLNFDDVILSQSIHELLIRNISGFQFLWWYTSPRKMKPFTFWIPLLQQAVLDHMSPHPGGAMLYPQPITAWPANLKPTLTLSLDELRWGWSLVGGQEFWVPSQDQGGGWGISTKVKGAVSVTEQSVFQWPHCLQLIQTSVGGCGLGHCLAQWPVWLHQKQGGEADLASLEELVMGGLVGWGSVESRWQVLEAGVVLFPVPSEVSFLFLFALLFVVQYSKGHM